MVGDYPAVLDSLQWLLESVGFSVLVFSSGLEFLDRAASSTAGCLVLDIRMLGMSGIDLFE